MREFARQPGLASKYFARGITVSHGTSVVYEAGEPVVIDGTPIKTGDLLHGDENGASAALLAALVALEELAELRW